MTLYPWSETIPPGDYFVMWVIDDLNSVPEFNENNNTAIQKDGSGNPSILRVNYALPIVYEILPTTADLGGSTKEIRVYGKGFYPNSLVTVDLPSGVTKLPNQKYLTAGVLSADIPAQLLTSPGNLKIQVWNPPPGGGLSTSWEYLTINNAVPSISHFIPASIPAESGTFDINIYGPFDGPYFTPTSVVYFDGDPVPVVYHSSTWLQAYNIPEVCCPGEYTVSVNNPSPGGGWFSAPFMVTYPGPHISSIDPPSVEMNQSSPVWIRIEGSGFMPYNSDNFVIWDGKLRHNVLISSTTECSFQLYPSETQLGKNITVQLINPSKKVSNPFTFEIRNPIPIVDSVWPNAKWINATSDLSVTVYGSHFVEGSVVTIDGVDCPTQPAYRRGLPWHNNELWATIPASLTQDPGNLFVRVRNPAPGGGECPAEAYLLMVYPRPTITSLSPSIAPAGSPDTTVTVRGTNFFATSKLQINETQYPITYVSPTELRGVIPAANLTTLRTLQIGVANPTDYAGGGTSNSLPFTVGSPVATISSLSPPTATAGGNEFTLILQGNGFNSGSQVYWLNIPRATHYTSPTQIEATILAYDIANGGYFQVSVINFPPSGGVSNSMVFLVNNPTPTITTVAPSILYTGNATYNVSITGTGFTNKSRVRSSDNQVVINTSFISPTRLDLEIKREWYTPAGGDLSVWVYNEPPAGGTSNTATITVQNPTPRITFLSQSNASARNEGIVMNLGVAGEGFINSTQVSFSGNPRPTHLMSPTLVIAEIPDSDLSTTGVYSVLARNPVPGGGYSNSLPFTVDTPIPYVHNISPNSVYQYSSGFTLRVNGTGFVTSSTVLLNGTNKTTSYISPTQLSAVIPASDLLNNGLLYVQVRNGDLGSNSIMFTVMAEGYPAISAINPQAGRQGTTVIMDIYGAQYKPGGNASLRHNTSGSLVPATNVTFMSNTWLKAEFTFPANAPIGRWNINVINPSGLNATNFDDRFFSLKSAAPPTLTGITPNNTAIGKTTFISNLSGTDFYEGIKVFMSMNGDGVVRFYATNVTIVSPTKLSCEFAIPEDMDIYGGYDTPLGLWDVGVENIDGQTTSVRQMFLVKSPSPPTVTRINPSSFELGRGESVGCDITGTGFYRDYEVYLHKLGAPLIHGFVSQYWNHTEIQSCSLTIPDTTPSGLYDVVVVNPDGQWGTLAGGYNITQCPGPSEGDFDPKTGDAGTTVHFNIHGYGYLPGAQVRLVQPGGSDIPAMNVVVLDTTNITCDVTIPSDVGGEWDILVTNPDGQSAVSWGESKFFVNSRVPLTVSGITPSTGGRGTTVVANITGTGFFPGARVSLWIDINHTPILGTHTIVCNNATITCEIPIPADAPLGNRTLLIRYPSVDQWNYLGDAFMVVADAISPQGITNLHNTTYNATSINWTWTDPADADFSKVMIYLNGTFKTNVTKGVMFYNATGLTPNTAYTIGTHTIDISGNINQTWVNHTARTAPSTTTGITVTVPNGGEDWKQGSAQIIKWNYTGNPGSNIKLELLKGMAVNQVITSNMSIGSGGAGSKSWTVPFNQTIGADYKIRVTSISNSAYTDTSNANFTISTETSAAIPNKVGVFRNSTHMFYLKNGTTTTTINWGTSTDLPLTGDWNRDGRTEVAVFRPSVHTFYLKNGTTTTAINWGISSDKPVTGDWNGDGRTDAGVFRNSTHTFYLKNGTKTTSVNWGISTDMPVTGDWNGDGRTDVGVFRNSTHMFYLKNGTTTTAISWGINTDLPVTGDWNGDGRTEVGVFRSSVHTFYLKNGITTTAISWGASTDLPVTGKW